ncbi:hypothetical protein PUNSTDRAFT_104212 [Punctularia strigosozonata HHB-11173 SS5]|uniref:uncharacterized protein n=1 Tax=Punctularia strigosozonata (strain HHB-11173) TaxID=741275 RepID=UPI00044166D6|nr:uncharacterized protein PUNSTDRAFT_104212 [Punctularia strigosozonata HHB-11173 SS5]EIN08016.1 hypothetical protein PUNSTDRAFT_104212 [Punctularia strigosozonata HHB-11173 SS5]
MISLATGVLHRARTVGHKFFHRLGIHCATHQIRLILISCLVITSLFYPALALYSSSQPQYISHYSSRLIDSFLAASGASARYAQQDLHAPWAAHDALRVRDDGVTRARCGRDQTLRMERLFVHSTAMEERGALSRPLLSSALKLERRLAAKLLERKLSCLKDNAGHCITFSPWAFWVYDEALLASDPGFRYLLAPTRNISIAGISVTPRMVLAGRDEEGADSAIEFSSFLALTYLFEETSCADSSGHTAWLHVLKEVATPDVDFVVEEQEPMLMALEYDPRSTGASGVSVLTVFIYIAYIVFFFWFSGSMRRIATVHSRIGLAFTGLVEIAVSTLTSLSVVALAGFKITMIPWQIFPVVIVFVGAENMFNLVDAVGKTSITLPMKERIAEGLSKAGTSNTLKVVTYNSILGTIAAFSYGAIRQFCAFAVVVLVAHWFLVHTFFITVVSIDMQRLELEELLQQNSFNPVPVVGTTKAAPQTSATRWSRLRHFVQAHLRGRAGKNVSLFLLLAVTAALYYSTSATLDTERLDPLTSPGSAAGRARVLTTLAERDSPAWQTWNVFNPTHDPLVHIRMESPIVVRFRPDADARSGVAVGANVSRTYTSRFTMRTLRAVVWLLNIFVLPIAATTTALYGLCLYLLKDTERLEAQKYRTDQSSSYASASAQGAAWLQECVSLTTLPRAFPSDVELIAASEDGSVVASVGLQNEVAVWRLDSQHGPVAVDVIGALSRSPGGSGTSLTVTAMAVNPEGSLLAVGTAGGVGAVWALGKTAVLVAGPFTLGSSMSSVAELRFLRDSGGAGEDPISTYLVVAYRAGTVVRWDLRAPSKPAVFTPSIPELCSKVALVPIAGDVHFLASFLREDGVVELSDTSPDRVALAKDVALQAGNLADPVSQVHGALVEVEGEQRLVIAAATHEGVVSVWDGYTEECIAMLDHAYGDINELRIWPAVRKACNHCGEVLPDVFTLSFSAGNVVTVYRAFVHGVVRYCSCARPEQYVAASSTKTLAKRGSRNGLTASGPPTPLDRSRRSSISGHVGDGFPFPVSNHGVHSRRGSEKDAYRNRGQVDMLAVPPDSEDQETNFFTPVDNAATWNGAKNTFWGHVNVTRIAHATFERGSWDVSEGKLVGLRRRPRERSSSRSSNSIFASPKSKPPSPIKPSTAGLAPATLDRWELWFYDPAQSRLQASSLSALGPDNPPSPTSRPSRRSADRRQTAHGRPDEREVPRLPFTKVSTFLSGRTFCLAGLGNTVACFQYSSKPVQ